MVKQYPRDFRERAIRLVIGTRSDHDTDWSAIRQVLTRLGVGPETVRKWVRHAEINAGLRPGVSESENAEIRRLKKEVAELKRANDSSQTASTFSQTIPRPIRARMIRYVDLYHEQFGAWLICRVLGNTGGGFMATHRYWGAKSRPSSNICVREQVLGDEIGWLDA